MEYLACALFVVRMDNNPLMYILTTPNLDATGHRWVGVLASFEFALEYQKGVDNGAADALSWVPIHHNHETVHSLLEGAIIGAVDWSEVEANKELLCEHMHLEDEVRVQAAKLAPMHMVDLGEELVHVDFTSVESTMELNKPPNVKNVLVITSCTMPWLSSQKTRW